MVEGVSCKLSFDLHVISPPQHTKKYSKNDDDDHNKRIPSSPLSSLAMSMGDSYGQTWNPGRLQSR